MEKRVEILNQLYNSQDEDGRLCNSRHGQTALELVEANLDVMKKTSTRLWMKQFVLKNGGLILSASYHLLYICKK